VSEETRKALRYTLRGVSLTCAILAFVFSTESEPEHRGIAFVLMTAAWCAESVKPDSKP